MNRLRTAIRFTFYTAIVLFVWYSLGAVAAQTAGWPLLAIASATLLGLLFAALSARTPHNN